MRFATGEHQMCMFGCVLFLNHKGSIKYTGEKKTPNKSANPAPAPKICLFCTSSFPDWRPHLFTCYHPFWDGWSQMVATTLKGRL